MPSTVNAGVGLDHLAGLHHLLEPAQVAFNLLARLLARGQRDQTPERAGRRIIAGLDVDLGAAAAGCRPEADDARVGDFRAADRTPGDELIDALVQDLGVPFEAAAHRAARAPARAQ